MRTIRSNVATNRRQRPGEKIPPPHTHPAVQTPTNSQQQQSQGTLLGNCKTTPLPPQTDSEVPTSGSQMFDFLNSGGVNFRAVIFHTFAQWAQHFWSSSEKCDVYCKFNGWGDFQTVKRSTSSKNKYQKVPYLTSDVGICFQAPQQTSELPKERSWGVGEDFHFLISS